MTNILVTLISSLLSGIIGVIISTYYYRKYENRKTKIDTFKNFVANRYDLKGDNFIKAINEIFVVFQDSEEVLNSLKQFHETTVSQQTALSNDHLVALFKSMCRNLNINPNKYSESMFLIPFNYRK